MPKRFLGEVYRLPPDGTPDGTPGGDNKIRPAVLLTDCDEDAEVATFAHCSTRGTESEFGAAHVLVDPFSGYRGTGFTKATYVHPSRLIVFPAEDLHKMPLPTGRLVDDLSRLRVSLAEALGLDTGSCIGNGLARGSMRGRMLQVNWTYMDEVGSRYVLVVAEPRYSSELRYMNVIPLLSPKDVESTPEDLLVSSASTWLQKLTWDEGILAVPFIQNIFYPQWIMRPLDCALDDQDMSAVDVALRTRFGM